MTLSPAQETLNATLTDALSLADRDATQKAEAMLVFVGAQRNELRAVLAFAYADEWAMALDGARSLFADYTPLSCEGVTLFAIRKAYEAQLTLFAARARMDKLNANDLEPAYAACGTCGGDPEHTADCRQRGR